MGHADSKRERMEAMELLHQMTQIGWTPTELAQQLDCVRSTVHRDLAETARRQPLINDGQGRYRLDSVRVVRDVRITPSEALAI